MLNRVKIQNFKSIGEPGVDLELKPLTFLVGPNGGGKSSILEAIGFASQKGSRRHRNEENFTFQELNDLHFRQQSNTLSIQIEATSSRSDINGIYTLLHSGLENQYSQIRQEFFPDAETIRRIEVGNEYEQYGENIIRDALFNKAFLLRGTRGIVDPHYTRREPEYRAELVWVGQQGQNTLEVLDRLRNAHFISSRLKIEKWSQRFGTSHVAASLSQSNRVEGSYQDGDTNTPLNLYLASTGSRQVLPIIVQLFWCDPNSILMIEEPEISLHPKAQIDVLEMFAEAINEEDKQIIATTHGLFLIQAIGYAVQKGWLKADQVAVHHIEKKKDVGTVSKQLKVNEKGYIEGWIPSFTRVERQLLNEWIKTLPEE